MTTRQTVWLALPVFAVAIAIYYPYSPGGRQAANIAAAERWIAQHQSQLAGDPQFAQVDVNSITAKGGGLLVSGEVPSAADVEVLRTLVFTPPPSFAVLFHVQPTTRPQQ